MCNRQSTQHSTAMQHRQNSSIKFNTKKNLHRLQQMLIRTQILMGQPKSNIQYRLTYKILRWAIYYWQIRLQFKWFQLKRIESTNISKWMRQISVSIWKTQSIILWCTVKFNRPMAWALPRCRLSAVTAWCRIIMGNCKPIWHQNTSTRQNSREYKKPSKCFNKRRWQAST